MKFIFYRTSLFVLYEDIISLSTLFACIFDINNGYADEHSANGRILYKIL